MLVVGPNRAFLDYIANVLPSLGERSVRQCTALDLCIPKVEITATDEPDLARWKGSADRLVELEQAALDAIQPPAEDVRVPIGARAHVFERGLIADWIDTAKSGVVPINQRRERLRVLAQQELLRRTGGEDFWSQAGPLKSVINACWPTQRPIQLVDRMLPGPSGRRRRWTAADQFLVDEANTLLNGTPFKYGHVVVDEAQDHSAVALRVIGRRAPGGSITMVGDVAQSTTPAGQERWEDVFAHLGADGSVADLTIGYRVPEPILEVANRLLPLTGVDAVASRSVRAEGEPPAWHTATPSDVASHRQGRHQRQAPPSHDRRGRPARTARIDHRSAVGGRAGRGRPCARTRPRRRAAVRARDGQGAGVRRRRRRQPARDPRRHARAVPACCTWR